MKNFLFLISIFFLTFSVAFTQINVYVDGSLPTNGNGTSWAAAYNDLNYALVVVNAANINNTYVIHVAKGTYTPDETSLRNEPFTSDNVYYNTEATGGGYSDIYSFGFVAAVAVIEDDPSLLYPHLETSYTYQSTLGTRDVAFSIKPKLTFNC